MGIIRVEKPVGVVVAFGGQTAIKLTAFLDKAGIPILGTSAESIDIAEDRARFDALLEQFHIRRPSGRGVNTIEEAVQAGVDSFIPKPLFAAAVMEEFKAALKRKGGTITKNGRKADLTGRRILLAELILAASQHQEVGEADLISFVRGGVGPCTAYTDTKEEK